MAVHRSRDRFEYGNVTVVLGRQMVAIYWDKIPMDGKLTLLTRTISNLAQNEQSELGKMLTILPGLPLEDRLMNAT